jgi:predicted AAA+ superfamily ATPase
MIKSISKELVISKIKFENNWWIENSIDADYNQMPRRVGKTVMLYHLIQDLIENGINPQKIIFITIENPIYNNILLEQLFLYAKEATSLKDKDGWYIIFDEIQYYKNWEVELKSLVDSYRNNKFIVSGSAAAALKFASDESGAGRFTDFLLPPLTFHEYITMKNLEHIIKPTEINWRNVQTTFYTSINIVELNKHFIKYINFGGYPEVIFSEKIQENPGRYIRQDIVDKVLLRDLPSLYGISDTRELNSLFTTIAYNTGEEFSLETLSRESQVNKNTLKKYIEYLEAAFLIKKVQRIDQAGKRFKRDHFFKIYLTNPSLRSALFSPITSEDDMIGRMVETAIFAQWIHRDWFSFWYSRWNGGEVDMVGLNDKLKPNWALEIKWSNRYFDNPYDLKSLLKFCSENNLDNPIVTTIDKEGTQECKSITIQYFPAAAYAYTVGKKTLEIKKNR